MTVDAHHLLNLLNLLRIGTGSMVMSHFCGNADGSRAGILLINAAVFALLTGTTFNDHGRIRMVEISAPRSY